MLTFIRYSGAGNDFVVMHEQAVEGHDKRRLATRACAQPPEVDGLILVRETEGEVRVRFFNPDGTEYATCGNGSRCAALYALDEGLVIGREFTLTSYDAEILAAVIREPGSEASTCVRLTYLIETAIEREVSVEGPEGLVTGWLVSIGVPHFVLPVNKMPEGPIEDLCRELRYDSLFGQDGANINLVSLENDEIGRIRTFERGVERETKACGSGCMAAAFALNAAGLCSRTLRLRVESGACLEIVLPSLAGAPAEIRSVRKILLGGPAHRLSGGSLPDMETPPG